MRRRQSYTALQLLLDVFSFLPVWAASTRLRVFLNAFTHRQLNWDQAASWAAPISVIIVLYLAISWKFRLYVVPQQIRFWTLVIWAAENSLAVIAASVVADFFFIQFGQGASRLFVLCLAPVTFAIFLATRCYALIWTSLAKNSVRYPRVAVIGDSVNASRLMARMETISAPAICGVILAEGAGSVNSSGHFPILGTTSQIAELVNSKALDEVILINDAIPEPELARCNRILWRMGVPVTRAFILSLETPSSGRSANTIELSTINGLPIVDLKMQRSRSGSDLQKRFVDVLATLTLMLVLAPFLIIVAVVVKLTFKGDLISRSSVVGKGGRHFTCFRFRTENQLSKRLWSPVEGQTPENVELKEDERTRAISKFLTGYSLDELPQFINILRGEMSLVGPRPMPAHKLQPDGTSKKFFAWSEARSQVRPGLTGLWQVAGRGGLTFQDMIRLDLEYIRHKSFMLDLRILIETPIAVVRAAGNQPRCEDTLPNSV